MTCTYLGPNFRKSLTFLRGDKYTFLQEELDEIAEAQAHKGPSKGMISTLSTMGSSMFLKPLPAAMIFVLFELSGFTVLSHYTATYLEKAGIYFDPLLGSTIIGVIRILASLSTVMVLMVMAKKTAFNTFGLISSLSMMSGMMSGRRTLEKMC